MMSETPEHAAAHLDLMVPGLDHDRNLRLVVSKQAYFAPSTVGYGRRPGPGYLHEKRHSLSLIGDPEVAEISAAIESDLAERIGSICESLGVRPFRVGAMSASCVCHRDGAFFRRHVDVRKRRPGRRRFTWVYYLNSEPKRFRGGELLLEHPGLGRRVIEPTHGRIVVFRSDLPHEVAEVSLRPDAFADARFTITGFINDLPTRRDRLVADVKQLLAGWSRYFRFDGKSFSVPATVFSIAPAEVPSPIAAIAVPTHTSLF
jgi:hypothetical protein